MGTPKKKGEVLTETAKSYIESLIDQKEYGYSEFVETKEMQKGILNEDKCINLINELDFTEYEKNTVRLSNDLITGECDIFAHDEDLIIDIKCSWSKKTFPKTKNQALKKIKKSGYDWQGVGYMMLWNVDRFKIAYCLTSTPEYLCEWEDYDLHNVDNVPIEFRRTEVEFKRDLEKENLVRIKVKQCREYAEFYKLQIRNRL